MNMRTQILLLALIIMSCSLGFAEDANETAIIADGLAYINSIDMYIKSTEAPDNTTENNSEAFEPDPALESAKNNKTFLKYFHRIGNAIAQDETDDADEKTAANLVSDVVVRPATTYSLINDTTPGFSAVPGKYDATQVTVPLGPYIISFSTRLANATFWGEYDALGHNKTAGSGKDYRTCTYDEGRLEVQENGSYYPAFRFTIYHYVGPSSYPPTDPDPNGMWEVGSLIDTPTMTREYAGPDPITIDGKQGTLITTWSVYHNINVVYPSDSFDVIAPSYYIVAYHPNDKTFVVLKTDNSLDYDKDIALVLQTLHITF